MAWMGQKRGVCFFQFFGVGRGVGGWVGEGSLFYPKHICWRNSPIACNLRVYDGSNSFDWTSLFRHFWQSTYA